jgi:hypothetical protein
MDGTMKQDSSQAVSNREEALKIIDRVIQTLDQSELEPIVNAMLTESHKAALSAMAIAQAEPDLLTQFLVLCKQAGWFTAAECDRLDDEYLEAKTQHAA